MNLDFHPIAEIFPPMNDDEFARLVEDIRTNGQLQPIYTYHDRIIDGRNRYQACQVLKIEPVTEAWSEKGSLSSFVISLNLNRRHLNESQRAMVAAKLTEMYAPGSEKNDSQICEPLSQADAAALLNVSPRSVWTAKQISKNSVPEIVEAIEQGELSVAAAAKYSEMPRTKQKRLIRKGIDNLRKYAVNLTKKTVTAAHRENSAECLVCNPNLAFTEDAFKTHLVKLLARAPHDLGRYIQNVIEEISEFALVPEVRETYEKILDAVDAGRNTRGDIKNFSRLDDVMLDAGLSFLLEHNTLCVLKQGGKHDKASGGRKNLYFRSPENVALKLQKESIQPGQPASGDSPLVFDAVRCGNHLPRQIREETGLTSRAIADALDILEDTGKIVVRREVSFTAYFTRENLIQGKIFIAGGKVTSASAMALNK